MSIRARVLQMYIKSLIWNTLSQIYRVFRTHLPHFMHGCKLSWRVTSKKHMCLPSSPATSACGSRLIRAMHFARLISLPRSYLSAPLECKAAVMENSGERRQMIGMFHVSCPSTWITSLPRSSALSSSLVLASFPNLTAAPLLSSDSPYSPHSLLSRTCMDKHLPAPVTRLQHTLILPAVNVENSP